MVGRPGGDAAVVLAPEAYEEYGRYVTERAWAVIEAWQVANADQDRDELYALVAQAVEEVRHERYEERLKAARDHER